MQNVGHYLGAISCFLLNNPFKLLFFPIARVVSLPFEKKNKKKTVPLLITGLWVSALITHRILRCSSFVTFRFGRTLLKSDSLWILAARRCSQRARKPSASQQPAPAVTRASFSSGKEKKICNYKTLSHFEISAHLNSSRPDSGAGSQLLPLHVFPPTGPHGARHKRDRRTNCPRASAGVSHGWV